MSSKWIGSLAIVCSTVPGHAAASQGRSAVARPAGGEEVRAALQRVVTGIVCLPDGSPAAGAVVVTSAGGQAFTEADGSFALELELPLDAESLDVTAFADEAKGSGSLVASARFVPAALSTSSSVGTLALTRTFACAPRWLPNFGSDPGTSDVVHAFAVFDDGDGPALYAGGAFTGAGNVGASHIARWDGSRWSSLSSFTNGSVYCLTVFDDGGGPALYAGGTFGSVGGVPASRIARWDGSSWSALGSGVGDSAGVLSLTVFDDGGGPALYAGGYFSIAGGLTTSAIARWDGSSWSALGSGVSGGYAVNALAVFDDGNGAALYAGGNFLNVGGVQATGIARWDGSNWSALGSGIQVGSSFGGVRALAVFDDGAGPALFVGGEFSDAGGQAVANIARWDGSSWSALDHGVGGVFEADVKALTVFDDGSGPALYVGGNFTVAGGASVTVKKIARWDGSSWSALGGGIDEGSTSQSVRALAVFDGGTGPALHAGGGFLTADDVVAKHVARWDGSSWAALHERWVDGDVDAILGFDDGSGPALYVGGSLTTVGGHAVSRIARWDGSSWAPLGSGVSGRVLALAAFDDGSGPALYAGGAFSSAGGATASCIAKWNGSSWAPLGSGLSASVAALAVFDDGSGPALYAGGGFTFAGGATANCIARWNGTSWAPLGSGMNALGSVSALVVFDDGSGPALYAGGRFTAAGGVAANGIARWDGSTWSPLGSGLSSVGPTNPQVNALAVHDDGSGPALYAAGTIRIAGGVEADNIARWDGSAWSPLGGGLGNGVQALIAHDAGSGFELYAGTPSGRRLARWDGATWTTLGLGINSDVMALASWDDGGGRALYVGGDFTVSPAGDSNLAKWGCKAKSTVRMR